MPKIDLLHRHNNVRFVFGEQRLLQVNAASAGPQSQSDAQQLRTEIGMVFPEYVNSPEEVTSRRKRTKHVILACLSNWGQANPNFEGRVQEYIRGKVVQNLENSGINPGILGGYNDAYNYNKPNIATRIFRSVRNNALPLGVLGGAALAASPFTGGVSLLAGAAAGGVAGFALKRKPGDGPMPYNTNELSAYAQDLRLRKEIQDLRGQMDEKTLLQKGSEILHSETVWKGLGNSAVSVGKGAVNVGKGIGVVGKGIFGKDGLLSRTGGFFFGKEGLLRGTGGALCSSIMGATRGAIGLVGRGVAMPVRFLGGTFGALAGGAITATADTVRNSLRLVPALGKDILRMSLRNPRLLITGSIRGLVGNALRIPGLLSSRVRGYGAEMRKNATTDFSGTLKGFETHSIVGDQVKSLTYASMGAFARYFGTYPELLRPIMPQIAQEMRSSIMGMVNTVARPDPSKPITSSAEQWMRDGAHLQAHHTGGGGQGVSRESTRSPAPPSVQPARGAQRPDQQAA